MIVPPWRVALPAIALITFPLALPGQTGQPGPPGPAGQILTETAFLHRLDAEHPARIILDNEVRQARADELAARQWPNPDLEITREELEFGSETVEETTEVAVSWEPPLPHQRRHRRAAAASAVEAAEALRIAQVWKLRGQWRAAYARWALAEVRHELLDAQAATLATLAEQARRRADAGEAAGLEARRLELEAAALQGEVARAEAESRRARAGILARLPDLPAGIRPELPDLPQLPQPATPATAPTAQIHPQILALEAESQAARSTEAALAPRIALPRITLGRQREESAGRRSDGPIVAFGWSIPLTHPHRAERAKAQAQADSLAARLELARRQWEAERTAAHAAYRSLRNAAEAAKRNAAEAAPAATAITRAYRLGEAPLTDLLDTLRMQAQARHIALDLLEEALAVHRDLEQLTATTAGGTTP
jgi:cobalt-zinc-cadmium efflux system outer membrane protein